ncbi:lamin tail domain-containing protein [Granulicella cerasi]|uniref:Lamin tail domain-containing protein n=1 Tax=Granulicella cerasi TaxID=741063 RepID=A0ABW1ZG74_9BACT
MIDQVYGAGGSSAQSGTALYRTDYVELFNLGTTDASIGGWSVQYAATTGTVASNPTVIPAGTMLPAGKRYLIASSTDGTVGAVLPVTPDLTGTLNMSSTAGRVYLLSNSTKVTSTCPTTSDGIVDKVSYGTGSGCSEGASPAPTPSTAQIVIRSASCTDTDQNGSDFSVASAPAPRNLNSAATPCGGGGEEVLLPFRYRTRTQVPRR